MYLKPSISSTSSNRQNDMDLLAILRRRYTSLLQALSILLPQLLPALPNLFAVLRH